VGLFYSLGFFNQVLDGSRYQQEWYTELNPSTLALSPARNAAGEELVIAVPLGDHDVFVRVWELHVGRTNLYLLDTGVPSNERSEDREITVGLYAGDQNLRIRQEVVLGIGGVRALQALGIEPSIFSMNEGHAAFLGVELLARAVRDGPYDEALTRTRSRIVYTNHTLVPAGNDLFPADMVLRTLGPYLDTTGLGTDRLLQLGAGGGSGGFSMPLLAFSLAGKANAVSQLHSEVIPTEWPGFAVEAITNGVHVPTWLGGEVRGLLNVCVPDWRSDNPTWSAIATIDDDRLWRAHEAQRLLSN